MVFRLLFLSLLCVTYAFADSGSQSTVLKRIQYEIYSTDEAPIVDGKDKDTAWHSATWFPLNHVIVGENLSPDDFSGRFKMVWTAERIYLLAEIVDNVLIDTHANPLEKYWDDDALEIFIDEDNSGGNHQFNYNAFAYHIALDNQSADIGPFKSKADELSGNVFVRLFPDHIQSHWQRSLEEPNKVIWEVSMAVYDDSFEDTMPSRHKPVVLSKGKEMGFMLSYCDADSTAGREHFIGSQDIPAVNGDKNRGYIDASVFGVLTLMTK